MTLLTASRVPFPSSPALRSASRTDCFTPAFIAFCTRVVSFIPSKMSVSLNHVTSCSRVKPTVCTTEDAPLRLIMALYSVRLDIAAMTAASVMNEEVVSAAPPNTSESHSSSCSIRTLRKSVRESALSKSSPRISRCNFFMSFMISATVSASKSSSISRHARARVRK